LARLVIKDYLNNNYDKIILAYTDFYSTMVQKPKIRQLLPFEPTSESDLGSIGENKTPANQANFEILKEKIKDEIYFKNFVGLSKELAPDGKEINLVGLTITRNGKEKKVQFTRLRKDIHSSVFISTVSIFLIMSENSDLILFIMF